MDALRETQLVGELKRLVLDQLHAIFGPEYPDGCTFSVTTSISINKSDVESYSTVPIYTAQAIVYTVPNSFTRWELLRKGSKLASISSAMGSLLGDLQSEMEKISLYMQRGDVYDGQDYGL